MRTQRRWLPVIVGLLSCAALPLVAQPEPVPLGSFSEPFTTFVAAAELVYPGELDWYSFDVAHEDSTLFILAEGVDGEIGIRAILFDDENVFVDATDGGYLEVTLASGSYSIRIDSVGSDAQSYTLVVSNGVESESNDGLLEADDVGEVRGTVRVFGSLQPLGDADFFRFLVPESGLPGGANALLVETKGATDGDTVIILYQYDDAEGRYLPIAFDDDSGEEVWSRLLFRPQPGARYAVRVEETVYPLDGIDDYLLSIAPIALRMDEEPNDTSVHAVMLEAASSDAFAWTADGLLDGDDVIDFYKLTIESPALVRINTESQPDTGDFDTLLALYKPDGDVLADNDDSGDSAWSRIVMPLEAGEYFITVEAYGLDAALTPYRLHVTASRVKTMSETEPNDTDETSQSIEWADDETLLITATIGLEGDIDSFRFELTEETTVVLETGPGIGSSTSSDTTLALYDEDLWEIATNDDAIGSWSRIEQTLSAGTYYVVVQSYYSDATFEYTLTISQPSDMP